MGDSCRKGYTLLVLHCHGYQNTFCYVLPGEFYMTADEIFVCLSAFIQQDAFIPGILQDLIQQDVIPKMLKRLKELDH